jgi:hypothetical protein
MTAVHRITGYSRASESLVEEHSVPRRLLGLAKELARVRGNDPNAVWSYPLSDEQAQRLAQAMHIALDTGRNEYFLEAFAAAESQAQPARRSRAV